MAELTKICPTADIAEGVVKSFEVGNSVLAVQPRRRVFRHRQ